MSNEMLNQVPVRGEDNCGCEPGLTLTRRTFVKTSALLGGAAAIASQLPAVAKTLNEPAQMVEGAAVAAGANGYALMDPNNILYSCCLQCNTGCPIKVKIVDGVVSKIDGNPYCAFHLLALSRLHHAANRSRRHRRLDLPEGTGWAAKHL
jgi:tetrathionate reductase subunit A